MLDDPALEQGVRERFEAKQIVDLGASEIDMVIDIGALIEGEYDDVPNDIAAVKTPS